MKILLSIVLLIILFVGCSDPSETKVIHTVLRIEKTEVLVVNKADLLEELQSKVIQYDSDDYNESMEYVVFKFWVDSYVGIISDFELNCGIKQKMDWYAKSPLIPIKEGFETGALATFSKQELDKYNCLQAGGQTRDLTGSLYGYAEYVEGRVTPVEHTVTSNTITYTAQEINEAFAVFGE